MGFATNPRLPRLENMRNPAATHASQERYSRSLVFLQTKNEVFPHHHEVCFASFNCNLYLQLRPVIFSYLSAEFFSI
jgi:hypothetical protein